MKKIILLLFVLTGILNIQASTPNSFKGNIHFQVTGHENLDMKFSTKEWLTAIHIIVKKKDNMRMILDLQKSTITLLTESGPNGKMGIVSKLDDIPLDNIEKANANSNVKIEKTNEKKSILGYECTKYIVTSDDGVADCWITEKIIFNPFEKFGKLTNQSGKLVGQDAFKNINGLAMEINFTDKFNKSTQIKVVSIDQNKPEESLFSTEGYEIMDLSNFSGLKNMGR